MPIGLVGGALVLVGALVAGVLLWPNDDPSPSLIGDPRTVDPCGFIDKAALARFGTSELERDYGEFNRCDIWVSPDGTDDNETQLTVWLERDLESADGTNRPVYPPGESTVCERIQPLPGEYGVRVRATHAEGVPGDLCAMADALLTSVLSVVHSGELPRKTAPESSSIASADACELLTSEDIDRVYDAGGLSREPVGYGGWRCTWTGAGDHVWIYLVRDYPPDAGNLRDLTDVAGHVASIDSSEEAGEDTCVVRVVHRSYRSSGHEGEGPTLKSEQFWIEVSGNGPMAEHCQRAEQLATVAAGRLPA